jgi:hypothetical protein
MSFTALAKLLVLVNVALALVLAALGFGIYTNRIDWPGTATPPPGEKATSEYLQNKAAVEEAQKAAGVALARWEEAGKQLTHLEERRPQDQAVYAKRLEVLEGKDAAGNPLNDPIRVFATRISAARAVLDEDAVPVFDEKPPSRGLQSRRVFEEELKSTEDSIKDKINDVTTLVKKQQELTKEINGLPGKQKGWRDLLAEETVATHNALAELESLKPLRYNRQVESELLQKRQHSLQARLQELQSIGMASNRP